MTKQDSTITGRVVKKADYTEWGIISYEQSAQTARMTEVTALAGIGLEQLTALQLELLYWERVGKQPQNYPDVIGIPARALNGIALTKWIAGRVGLGWRECEAAMQVITQILEQHAKAGR